jgi:hypothetical protein
LSSDEASSHLIPFTASVRADKTIRYDLETKSRCFVLYATAAARNCRHAALLYQEEHPGEQTPSTESITVWAREEHWADQADDLWRQSKGRTLHELQVLATANAQLAQMRLNQILMNTDRRSVEERIVTLKAIDLSQKAREKMADMTRVQPPDAVIDEDTMDRDERERKARQALVQRETSRKRG